MEKAKRIETEQAVAMLEEAVAEVERAATQMLSTPWRVERNWAPTMEQVLVLRCGPRTIVYPYVLSGEPAEYFAFAIWDGGVLHGKLRFAGEERKLACKELLGRCWSVSDVFELVNNLRTAAETLRAFAEERQK